MYVFLSHSHKDKALAAQIEERISDSCIKVRSYKQEAVSGSNRSDIIEEAVKQCLILIVLITKNTQYSRRIKKNSHSAKKYGKEIILLLCDNECDFQQIRLVKKLMSLSSE